jgi:hypothetical protein
VRCSDDFNLGRKAPDGAVNIIREEAPDGAVNIVIREEAGDGLGSTRWCSKYCDKGGS